MAEQRNRTIALMNKEDKSKGCQSQLNRIKRKSSVTKTAGDASSPANASKITVTTLPPEMLELIFKNVGPKDLLNCWNTCLVWRNALGSINFYFKMVLPFVLKYLSGNDLLRCSSVSKSWNATVDVCIQQEFDTNIDNIFDFNHHKSLPWLHLSNVIATDFTETVVLSGNLTKPQSKLLAANPVAFRCVHLEILLDEEMLENLYDDAEGNQDHLSIIFGNLFQRLNLNYNGHLIQYLCVQLYVEEYISSTQIKNLFALLKEIRSSLELMSNLRLLQITTCPNQFFSQTWMMEAIHDINTDEIVKTIATAMLAGKVGGNPELLNQVFYFLYD